MKTCLVFFGDEILRGSIINTNASYLSKQLEMMGFSVERHLVLSDFDPSAKAILQALASEFPLIICTGGLGPTIDDKTRALFAELLNSELYFDESIYQELSLKFGDQPYHKIQSMMPKGATFLNNTTGTAKGLCIKLGNSLMCALPGVPHELKTMFEHEVVKVLDQRFPNRTSLFEKHLSFFDLIEVQIDPHIHKLSKLYPKVSFGIYPSYGIVKMTFRGDNLLELEEIQKYFLSEFPSNIYAKSLDPIEKVLIQCLQNQGLKLASAESVSGGHIATRLVAIPGVSNVFLGSLVTYSNALKSGILGVLKQTLDAHGAVSEETVLEMAKGVLSKTGADVAIATSGIAGPEGATATKPLGLVYIGVALKGGDAIAYKCQFHGDRDMVIEKAATHAFGYLWQMLKIQE